MVHMMLAMIDVQATRVKDDRLALGAITTLVHHNLGDVWIIGSTRGALQVFVTPNTCLLMEAGIGLKNRLVDYFKFHVICATISLKHLLISGHNWIVIGRKMRQPAIVLTKRQVCLLVH